MYFTFYSTSLINALSACVGDGGAGGLAAERASEEKTPLLHLPSPATARSGGSGEWSGDVQPRDARCSSSAAAGGAVGVAGLSLAACIVLLRGSGPAGVGSPVPGAALLLASAPFLGASALLAALLRRRNEAGVSDNSSGQGNAPKGFARGGRMPQKCGVEDVWMGLMVACAVVAMLLAACACSAGLGVVRVAALMSSAPAMGAAALLTATAAAAAAGSGGVSHGRAPSRTLGSVDPLFSSSSSPSSSIEYRSGATAAPGLASRGGGSAGGSGGLSRFLPVALVVTAAMGVVLTSRGAVSPGGVIAALVAAALSVIACACGAKTLSRDDAPRVSAWFAFASFAASLAFADRPTLRAALRLHVVLAGAAAASAVHASAVASRFFATSCHYPRLNFLARLAPLPLAVPFTFILALVAGETLPPVDLLVGAVLIALASATVVACAAFSMPVLAATTGTHWLSPSSPFFLRKPRTRDPQVC